MFCSDTVFFMILDYLYNYKNLSINDENIEFS